MDHLYISYIDVAHELVRLCPVSKNKKLLELWKNIVLGIHAIRTYEVDERGRLRERFPDYAQIMRKYYRKERAEWIKEYCGKERDAWREQAEVQERDKDQDDHAV